MKERAADAFAKYHGRLVKRIENPRTRLGMLVKLMLARKPRVQREEVRERRRVEPAGITQDASGWYNQCGRPKYPIMTGRGAVSQFEAQHQKH